MTQSKTKATDVEDAAADQATRAENAVAEKRASDHRNQIRSVAQAAVQAMVNAHRGT